MEETLKTIMEAVTLDGTTTSVEKPYIIQDLKLLASNQKTLNNRIFLDSAVESAKQIFENASVYIDHPTNRSRPEIREYEKRNGTMKNLRVIQESNSKVLKGDWHLNPMHPATSLAIWDCEHKTPNVGISVNAKGYSKSSAEGEIVSKFDGDRSKYPISLDWVAEPSGCKNMFESLDIEVAQVNELNTLKESVNKLSEANAKLEENVIKLLHEVDTIKNKPIAIAPNKVVEPKSFDPKEYLFKLRNKTHQ